MTAYPYLQVTAGGEKYFVPTAQVIEVTGVAHTTPVPLGPRALLGLMHLHGQIVLVVDVPAALGRNEVQPRTTITDEPLVIVRHDTTLIGLRVDHIDGPSRDASAPAFELERVVRALAEGAA